MSGQRSAGRLTPRAWSPAVRAAAVVVKCGSQDARGPNTSRTRDDSEIRQFEPITPFGAAWSCTRLRPSVRDCLPPQSRDEARASVATADHVRSTIDEYVQAGGSRIQAASMTDLAGKPLVVLTAGSGSSTRWMADQRHLAGLSSNSSHRVIDGAVHAALLHDERYAEATTQAILDVLSAIRTARPLGE